MSDSTNLSVLNFAEALERVDNDRDFYFELVSGFFVEYPVNIKRIHDALAQKDSHALEGAAHAIKGALGNLSAISSCQLAFEMEKAGKSANMTEAAKLLPKLEEQIEQFRKRADEIRNDG